MLGAAEPDEPDDHDELDEPAEPAEPDERDEHDEPEPDVAVKYAVLSISYSDHGVYVPMPLISALLL